jgi:hypothetical protein
MLDEGGCLSSPEVGTIVGHLFLNAVDHERGNTIVNCYGPSSYKALPPHRSNVHQTKVERDLPSSLNI